MSASENSRAAGRVAFTYPNFVLFQLARFFIVLAGEMPSVAVGWQVSLVVTGLWAGCFPELRRTDKLDSSA